jgi:mannose-6-phosphate isomerase
MKSKTVIKPWGKEEWIAHNQFYALKLITLNQGHRTSLHYHDEKHETYYVNHGRILSWLEGENGDIDKKEMQAGSIVEIVPGRAHRVEAIEDTILIEVSTPHLDDVIRVEDDFGRGSGPIASEHDLGIKSGD